MKLLILCSGYEDRSTFGDNELEILDFVMVYNTHKNVVENVKFIHLPFGIHLTSVNFGPYDNGFL